jgi:hypothetical protein
LFDIDNSLKMVGVAAFDMKATKTAAAVAQAEAPEFEKVNWMREPNMRKLYFYCGVLCVASATTGYDG